jgi:hypothetical protein
VGLEHVVDGLAAGAAPGAGTAAVADLGDRARSTRDFAVDISFTLTETQADDH